MSNTLLKMAVITDSITNESIMMSIDTNLNDQYLRINSLEAVMTLMPTRDTTLSSADTKREEAPLPDVLPLLRKQLPPLLLLQLLSQLLKKLSQNLSGKLNPNSIISTVMMNVITDLIQKRSMTNTSAIQLRLITRRLRTTTKSQLLSITPDLSSTTNTIT